MDLPRSKTRVDATWASMASFMAHVHALPSCQRRVVITHGDRSGSCVGKFHGKI